jgi:hypothetical protein
MCKNSKFAAVVAVCVGVFACTHVECLWSSFKDPEMYRYFLVGLVGG